MSEAIRVGIAEISYCGPASSIRTTGLGSCVGIILFDPMTRLAGMAHIMLPDSSMSRTALLNEAKFADTAVKAMVKNLEMQGVKKIRMKAKIAGGAQMFQFSSGQETMRIGPRNVEAVKSGLADFRIPLVAEDTGGDKGRTIEFNTDTFELLIKTVHQKEYII
ncbi:chemotaxis protein CheD [Fictibacillus terranigra]|uniref:Probable chemoreceptor glutamine deamidase CheD n=1 Tax=Fictibacillus terranigra TaxID=3058424 RepID=A0ABT8E6A4_9BACL|nr:chemotaxis protein CheD [Fictibacillus sp. CENA-BCM004]MDN4073415.1 chemotaxis protein CheD [Fictibacillus sp. CENA-BCM004]